MVPETVALGPWGAPGAQIPPGSRPLRADEVEELVSLLAPRVRASRGLGQRGRLFLSTSSSSSPGGAPPRGTRRVRPLRSLAEATVIPPPAQNPHPPTPPQGRVGGRGGGGGGAGGGARVQGFPPRSCPTVGPRPLPRPQRLGRTARAREAAPRVPAKAPPLSLRARSAASSPVLGVGASARGGGVESGRGRNLRVFSSVGEGARPCERFRFPAAGEGVGPRPE